MEIKQIIYSSRPFGFDDTSLNGILMASRSKNPRDEITGALICRRDLYLQMLEGPSDKIDDLLERIRRDDRHVEVTMHHSSTEKTRMFGAWAMLHDPAVTLLWSMDEIADGALDAAAPGEIRDIFVRMAAEHAEK